MMNLPTPWSTALAALVIASPVLAQTTSTSGGGAPPPPTAWERWTKEIKNPTPWLNWGGDLRLRNEYFDNSLSLNADAPRHEQDYFRTRGRIWGSVQPAKDLSIYGRVAAEPRTWMEPSYSSGFRNQSGTEWRYGIVDSLNLKWANAFDQPLTVTVGRQDIQFGEPLNWWLVADGTPGDGSWTFFLDSARLTYEPEDLKTRFDLVCIYQSPHPDEWAPTFGSASYRGTDYLLTDQREEGIIAYISNKSLKSANLDAYFIYKSDDQETMMRAGEFGYSGDNAKIYTLGGRVYGQPWNHWSYSVEGAYQFGKKEDNIGGTFAERDIDAFGMNGNVTYAFKDRLNNRASFVFEWLSGDDPATSGKDEMFDILWGRWPRWSELYIYSYVPETRKIAQLNNIQRVGLSWSLNPAKKLTVSAAYNALFAPQEVPTRAASPAAFTSDGNFRGHYAQAVAKYQFNKNVSAHLWSEFLWQGDYYAARDRMTFLRAEVLFTF